MKKLPVWMVTVTPLSKILAASIFIILPFVAFFLGLGLGSQISPRTSTSVKNIIDVSSAPSAIGKIFLTRSSEQNYGTWEVNIDGTEYKKMEDINVDKLAYNYLSDYLFTSTKDSQQIPSINRYNTKNNHTDSYKILTNSPKNSVNTLISYLAPKDDNNVIYDLRYRIGDTEVDDAANSVKPGLYIYNFSTKKVSFLGNWSGNNIDSISADTNTLYVHSDVIAKENSRNFYSINLTDGSSKLIEKLSDSLHRYYLSESVQGTLNIKGDNTSSFVIRRDNNDVKTLNNDFLSAGQVSPDAKHVILTVDTGSGNNHFYSKYSVDMINLTISSELKGENNSSLCSDGKWLNNDLYLSCMQLVDIKSNTVKKIVDNSDVNQEGY